MVQMMYKKESIYSQLHFQYEESNVKSELWTGDQWKNMEELQKKICKGIYKYNYTIDF
jgi:hypothetical protein